jgi:hypothetical protein
VNREPMQRGAGADAPGYAAASCFSEMQQRQQHLRQLPCKRLLRAAAAAAGVAAACAGNWQGPLAQAQINFL